MGRKRKKMALNNTLIVFCMPDSVPAEIEAKGVMPDEVHAA